MSEELALELSDFIGPFQSHFSAGVELGGLKSSPLWTGEWEEVDLRREAQVVVG